MDLRALAALVPLAATCPPHKSPDAPAPVAEMPRPPVRVGPPGPSPAHAPEPWGGEMPTDGVYLGTFDGGPWTAFAGRARCIWRPRVGALDLVILDRQSPRALRLDGLVRGGQLVSGSVSVAGVRPVRAGDDQIRCRASVVVDPKGRAVVGAILCAAPGGRKTEAIGSFAVASCTLGAEARR